MSAFNITRKALATNNPYFGIIAFEKGGRKGSRNSSEFGSDFLRCSISEEAPDNSQRIKTSVGQTVFFKQLAKSLPGSREAAESSNARPLTRGRLGCIEVHSRLPVKPRAAGQASPVLALFQGAGVLNSSKPDFISLFPPFCDFT